MSLDKDKISDKLLEFGLEPEEVQIYLLLLQDSPQSILDLSRKLKLGRNIVYRQVERLKDKNLAHSVSGKAGSLIAASNYHNLEKLLNQREAELNKLKSATPDLFGALAQITSQHEAGQIKYYTGAEGLKQITLNSLEANQELLICEVANLAQFIDQSTTERIRQVLVERKIVTRQITNQRKISAWTNISELVRHYWKPRYLDPKKLQITSEFLIYNQTLAMYHYTDGQFWGLEVISSSMTNMQKQMFNFIWNSAEKMKITDNFGSAEI